MRESAASRRLHEGKEITQVAVRRQSQKQEFSKNPLIADSLKNLSQTEGVWLALDPFCLGNWPTEGRFSNSGGHRQEERGPARA